jgi:hypothetical protein
MLKKKIDARAFLFPFFIKYEVYMFLDLIQYAASLVLHEI